MAPRPQSFARPLESGPGYGWPKYVVAGGHSLKPRKCQAAIRSDAGFGNADGHGQSVKNGAPLHTACVTSFHVAKSISGSSAREHNEFRAASLASSS